LQITPEIISQFAFNFMEKSPEKLMDETRTIGHLACADLVINSQKLESWF
jgi:hypothetical protein